jgi:hypothetical protein
VWDEQAGSDLVLQSLKGAWTPDGGGVKVVIVRQLTRGDGDIWGSSSRQRRRGGSERQQSSTAGQGVKHADGDASGA